MAVPVEVDVGAHDLVLRRWRMDDVDRLVAAIDASLPELRRWMPWAEQPPTPESVRAFLKGSGATTGFGLFDGDGQLVGAFGLHDRRGPGILEIGYWVRTDRAGQGYATAAARALADAAFAHAPDVDRIEIRCHPANLASGAIPRKLGYRLDAEASTESQLVWALSRSGCS